MELIIKESIQHIEWMKSLSRSTIPFSNWLYKHNYEKLMFVVKALKHYQLGYVVVR